NLVTNAIKYRSNEHPPHIHISIKEKTDTWLISVRDNGMGIKPDFVGQIFQPFRRLHTWEQIHGTGLGLAICKKIVENHGGEINVESKPGEGSVFHFTLSKSLLQEAEAA